MYDGQAHGRPDLIRDVRDGKLRYGKPDVVKGKTTERANRYKNGETVIKRGADCVLKATATQKMKLRREEAARENAKAAMENAMSILNDYPDSTIFGRFFESKRSKAHKKFESDLKRNANRDVYHDTQARQIADALETTRYEIELGLSKNDALSMAPQVGVTRLN